MTRIEKLRDRFRDEEYRHAYIESFLDSVIATQIRLLREGREWSQEELGDRIDTQQSAVSRLEDPNYSSWSLATLKKLAQVFDVALSVRFESFGEMLYEIEDRSPATLWQPSFDEDPSFQLRVGEEQAMNRRYGQMPMTGHRNASWDDATPVIDWRLKGQVIPFPRRYDTDSSQTAMDG